MRIWASVRAFRWFAIALVVALIAPVVTTRPAAAQTYFPPEYVRSIGGIGHGSLYPWGLAYNPVSDELVVTDYVNYQIRRFSTDGDYLGDFEQPTNPATGDPESVLAAVAVDPRNGDVYVGKPKPDTLAKFTKDGVLIRDTVVPGARYVAWMSVDADGNVWVLDSHLWNTDADPSKLFKLDDAGNVLQTWDLDFPFDTKATQSYGIDVADDGRVFLSDATNRTVHVLGADGSWLYDIGSAAELSGDLRSVLIDEAASTVSVVDAIQDEIEVYTLAGTHVRTIGGESLLNAPRQITHDAAGRLWVAEYGNARLHVLDADGNSIDTYPVPSPEAPAGLFMRPKDVDVDSATGEIWVADSWNQRFQRFAADGTFVDTWGDRSNTPPYGMKYPRGIGFDSALRRLWVTQHAAGTIMRYDDTTAYIDTLGLEEERSGDPDRFYKPLDVEFHAGNAIVTDSNTNLIKVLDADTGTELLAIARKANGVAVDPATGNIYALDQGADKVFVYDPAGSLLFSFGSRGSGDGQFREAWDGTIVDDTLYVTDRTMSRVQAFALDGTYLGKWGGFGTGVHEFANPAGISHDADGLLYVADTENDRIQVFDPTAPRAPYEWTKPTVDIDTPNDGQAVETTASVALTGTASDNAKVAGVGVAVQDVASGDWWDSESATWGTTQAWAPAAIAGPAPVVDAQWTWAFPAATYGRSFHAEVKAIDAWGNESPGASVDFEPIAPLPPDTIAPETSLANPADGAVLPLEALTVAGAAQDDRAVGEVFVSIQNAGSGEWWTGSGWAATPTSLTADVDAPGTPQSNWNYAWSPPSAGNFVVEATARDAAGNADASPDSAGFELVADAGPPDASVSAPTSGAQLPAGQIDLSGAATDDVGVATVDVAIRDKDASLWWTGSDWGGFTWIPATVDAPGSTSVGWSFAIDLPTGNYALMVRARDTSGNSDPTKPWVPFGVFEGAADVVPPDATVDVPVRNATYPVGPLALSGAASDDVGVDTVHVAIRDRVTLDYWSGSGWGSFTWLEAGLDAPDTTSTGWTYNWAPPTAGSYSVVVRATDTSGNIDPSKPWVPFLVS